MAEVAYPERKATGKPVDSTIRADRASQTPGMSTVSPSASSDLMRSPFIGAPVVGEPERSEAQGAIPQTSRPYRVTRSADVWNCGSDRVAMSIWVPASRLSRIFLKALGQVLRCRA